MILLNARLAEMCSAESNDFRTYPKRLGVREIHDPGLKGRAYILVGNVPADIEFDYIKLDDIRKHSLGADARENLVRYDNFCSILFYQCFGDIKNPISDPNGNIGVFTFGELIGLSKATSRFIIDTHYAQSFPTFGTFAQSYTKAERFAITHGGIYSLFRLDRNAETNRLGYSFGMISKCRLSIRYPVPYKGSQRSGRELFRIRCKMNIPAYQGENPSPTAGIDSFKYDGFVSQRDKYWWQLLFQQRRRMHPNSEDLVLIYIDKTSFLINNRTARWGKILYQDQSKRMAPNYADCLLIKEKGSAIRNLPSPGSFPESIIRADRYFETVPGERPIMRSPYTIDIHRRDSWSPEDRDPVLALLKQSSQSR
ncbi:MAG: hypothetical protein ACFB03_17925 [Paracoccaceae bacterium]